MLIQGEDYMKSTLKGLLFMTIAIVAMFSIDADAGRRRESARFLARNPIYHHIVTVRPSIPKAFAMRLSNLLHKYSRKYRTDAHLSIAIARQESGIRNINRYEWAVTKNSAGYLVRTKNISDIGIFQFHVNTIAHRKLDPELLQVDLEYQVKEHVRLLRDKIRICKNRKTARKFRIPRNEAWSCYHSATPSHRKTYVRLVSRFFKGFTTGNE